MSSPPIQTSPAPGCLYLVATPIGNRQDLSPRAIEILRDCDGIACENTHRAQRLLEPLEIRKPLWPYHEGNEKEQAEALCSAAAAGKRIAVISEAGTPAISDPGFRLARLGQKLGIQLIPIPGANAAITALSASGLPSDGFLFLGFLPPKRSARLVTFEKYRDFEYTLIFYESTHRIEKFLNDLIEVLGAERTLCVARELTKLHETILSGTAGSVRERLLQGSAKGEFVVLVAKEGYSL